MQNLDLDQALSPTQENNNPETFTMTSEISNMEILNTSSTALLELDTTQTSNSLNNIIGLLLALSSSFFIGASFVVNKKSLQNIKEDKKKKNRLLRQSLDTAISNDDCSNGRDEENGSGQTGIESDDIFRKHSRNLSTDNCASPDQNSIPVQISFEFLKSPLWWLGTATMALGEIANFSAYIFSPASLVTPLGALSVVVTCILSSYFLKEKMNLFTKIGVLLAFLGSMFVVIHAPEGHVLTSLDVLLEDYFCQKFFLIFSCVQIIFMVILFILQERHYFFRILLSALSGSFCVVFTKSTGVGVTQFIETKELAPLLSNWFFYVTISGLILTISLQMIQITRALNLESASTVMPIYYVSFTITVMVSMNVLFQEYKIMEWNQMLSIGIGFGVLCCAVFMLHGFSQMAVYSFSDIKKFAREE